MTSRRHRSLSTGRITATIAIIVLEVTGEYSYLPAIGIAVIAAKLVGELINEGIYHEMIHTKGASVQSLTIHVYLVCFSLFFWWLLPVKLSIYIYIYISSASFFSSIMLTHAYVCTHCVHLAPSSSSSFFLMVLFCLFCD